MSRYPISDDPEDYDELTRDPHSQSDITRIEREREDARKHAADVEDEIRRNNELQRKLSAKELKELQNEDAKAAKAAAKDAIHDIKLNRDERLKNEKKIRDENAIAEREDYLANESWLERRSRKKQETQDKREITAMKKKQIRDDIIADKVAQGIDASRARKLLAESERQYNKEVVPLYKRVADKVGGVVIAGTKKVLTNPDSRSGKRATKEWRRENREYRSEARKLKKSVASPSVFNGITMFGENRAPVRSRYAGANEIGTTTDPLSNWGSAIMGLPKIQQDRTIEGSVRRTAQPERRNAHHDDPLKSITSLALGGSRVGQMNIAKPAKQNKKGGGLAGFNRMLRGF